MAPPLPASTFHLTIVSPDDLLFDGPINRLLAPGSHQEIAILPDHTPLYAELIQGELKLTLPDKQEQSIPIDAGILRVKSNRASIITSF